MFFCKHHKSPIHSGKNGFKRQSRSCDLRPIDKRPHFYILPSQFPNDYLSITDTKTFGAYTDSYRRGFTPHSLFIDYAWLLHFCDIINTLCESIQFYRIILSYSDKNFNVFYLKTEVETSFSHMFSFIILNI